MNDKTDNLELNINYRSPSKQVDMKEGYDENFKILDNSIQLILGTLENTDVEFAKSIDLDESYLYEYYAIPISWSGLENFYGSSIWSDNYHTYLSYQSGQQYYHYKFNKVLSKWEPMHFNFESFTGGRIWHANNRTFYSIVGYYSGGGYIATHKVFNSYTESWEDMTWNGSDLFDAIDIWHTASDTYFTNRRDQMWMKLNTATYTWEPQIWHYIGCTDNDFVSGGYYWYSNNHVYYSQGTRQFILNEETSTWSVHNWGDASEFDFYGSGVWKYDANIFLSSSYRLNLFTDKWEKIEWNNNINFDGSYMWTMEGSCFNSYNDIHYQILRK